MILRVFIFYKYDVLSDPDKKTKLTTAKQRMSVADPGGAERIQRGGVGVFAICLALAWMEGAVHTATASSIAPKSAENEVTVSATAEGGALLHVEDILPLALSAEQGVAVVQKKDGSLFVLRRGQSLPPNGYVVTDVQADRIALRVNPPGQAQETIWIYRLSPGEVRPRIQRFVSSPPDTDAPKASAGDWIPISLSPIVPVPPSQPKR